MTIAASAIDLGELLAPHASRAQHALERLLVEPGTPSELADAMRHAVLGGGKRLRPAVVYLAAIAAGGADDELADRAAAAIEMVHCYSLVHDDLPAMDDDALRRGRPTVHVQFGEAMAILAGDAMLTRAFAVLGETGEHAAALTAELARGAGAMGMIAGQVADMGLCAVPDGIDGPQTIAAGKTGALFRAAARMGGACANASEAAMSALGEYGLAMGIAFQVVDDLLDLTSSAEQLGKNVGKDSQAGKRTFPAQAGMGGAARLADELTQRAVRAAESLGRRGAVLANLSQLLRNRTQ